jgi:glucokinase
MERDKNARMTSLLLALDFGGTKHAAAVIARGEQTWRGSKRVASVANPSAQSDMKIMFALAYELLDGAQPAAIGVSFGGPVEATSGTVRLSHHVAGWENIPLRELLEQQFQAPAAVDNDANVAAWGEYCFGAGKGADSMLYITVSTGVGGGWVLNEKIWHGADGMAGEIGHIVVDPNGPTCLCGKRGCVERLASGPYIAQRAREWLQMQPERGQTLQGMVNGNLDAITAQIISAAAAQGDELAWEALAVAAWALGVGIGNSINLINPSRVILGGGVTKSGERFWQMLQRVARETALPQMSVNIVPAALGDDAPLWGAVALAKECAEG